MTPAMMPGMDASVGTTWMAVHPSCEAAPARSAMQSRLEKRALRSSSASMASIVDLTTRRSTCATRARAESAIRTPPHTALPSDTPNPFRSMRSATDLCDGCLEKRRFNKSMPTCSDHRIFT